MSETIWKFPLQALSLQTIEMPQGAEILSVGDQRGQLCLWARVDPSARTEPRRVAVIGTGHDLPKDQVKLIGMVMLLGGDLIFHIFEVTA